MLIRLMGRTGIVLNSLTEGTRELALTRICSILRERDFIEFLLPWLNELMAKSIELSQICGENVKQTISGLLNWEANTS